jgi:sulfur relay (sulfurtransferase) DsrC/TusE family protein
MFIFEGNEIETDSEGYLKDTTQWSEAMADLLAIALTSMRIAGEVLNSR